MKGITKLRSKRNLRVIT